MPFRPRPDLIIFDQTHLTVARGREEGVVLVVVLWMLVGMSFLVLAFGSVIRFETMAVANTQPTTRIRAAADAGVHYGIAMLLAAEPKKPWYPEIVAKKLNFDGAEILIIIEDEAGKIDLNSASDDLIRDLVRSVGGGSGDDTDRIADAILDWRDEDSDIRLKGAEATAYRDAGLNYAPRNGRFESTDELRLVLGMTDALFSGLSTATTVFSRRPGINPLVAPESALRAIPGIDPAAVDALLAARKDTEDQDITVVGSTLSSASKETFINSFGPVYAIRSFARMEDGSQLIREGIIWITRAEGNGYWIFDWRVGRRIHFEKYLESTSE